MFLHRCLFSIFAGILRYPSPYSAMVRPLFPPRPPGALSVVPAVPRPLVPGIPGVRPVMYPIIRPVIPSVTPAEKPQTTVYIGKIAPSVENDFMMSLLQFCGPVKSWKRPQDPANGTPRGFGFCEFESAEGVLRALRLLTKFNIDGQELMLNVNQATKEYLERYVEKKTENSKNFKETQVAETDKDDGTGNDDKKGESPKSSVEVSNNDSEKGNKDNHDLANFGIVTDEDKAGDREAIEKLTSMIEERLKTKPLPPPPPPSLAPADGSGNSHLELPSKSRDGDADIMRSFEGKNDDETISDNKAASEQDKPETSSPDRSRGYDRRSRDRDRERDLKREKEREIERYERETERERVRKEREQRRKIEEAEREYEEHLKDWEYREREKEKQRQYEKERDKERERKRRKEILHDEEDEEDDLRKRWRRSALEDRRRKRLREKEDDLADRLKEEEEITESKRRDEEEKLEEKQRDELKLLSGHVLNGSEKTSLAEGPDVESKDEAIENDYDGDSGNENHAGDEVLQNGTGDESNMTLMAEPDTQHSGSAPARKLGFGLVGSGKRAAVPSVFHEEEDDDARKEKKMRPLVPIDYSTEELQAVQPAVSGAQPPNLVAAAEFAKRISNVAPREEKPDVERERSRRSHDRSSQRDRDRNEDNSNRNRDDNKEKVPDRDRDRNRDHGSDKVKTPDKQKLLDAKQLIDMIPKTKEELFLYEINWAVYDKHELHERMRPWISKKITEFLGEEETTLVDYIVSSTQDHVKASQMLEMLQVILDDEAEMFVLKMWRMLIFEIKKVETGLSLRSKS
ncbi:SPLICING FACTOR PWI DOMAIN-CONTAINING PROTEIN / RNA RECOGNITION MOTIF (RRM)-CONTAINING PROTEIN [Salix koriyanagi]|uniref:SPLICING FACTOR PWI DOMAIN-CONTAINING PROTEIN / RNA RECOGNITION MOTIF (RRM)-CONTAINING PROTEIN n=1 Tax=Salix koriyanagi TaxID=2511006 RepID=A0A9Q0WQT7_9ROSI|nr:SPLICING FACTOR PWI DOMAIN-CONTAINING PROTEIN / RNA RECOGNITION MOTIF (RRM)-CONTAINING PROTEIN [Salix koriyanagi]KAJ6771721.1 SPLICING FACTOR PWI DOMAIN-CONTAINING PROTEIN / RNA RECOGNITION MOTIF (RRM)-CONTAINING PROTEIN [Salix koriyanagi]